MTLGLLAAALSGRKQPGVGVTLARGGRQVISARDADHIEGRVRLGHLELEVDDEQVAAIEGRRGRPAHAVAVDGSLPGGWRGREMRSPARWLTLPRSLLPLQYRPWPRTVTMAFRARRGAS